MAIAMPKVDPMKSGFVVLLLADLALGYPVYETFSADPKSEMKPVTVQAKPIQLPGGSDADTEQMKTGFPPRELLGWDPFKIPKGVGPIVEGESEGQAVVSTGQPVQTDNIRLHGIINFNGQYRALVSVGGGASTIAPQQGGQGQGQGAAGASTASSLNPPEEVRKGMILPGTSDIKAEDIRRDGMLLTQPGSLPTFLPLTVPGLSSPKPWFRADDAFSIRGRLELNR